MEERTVIGKQPQLIALRGTVPISDGGSVPDLADAADREAVERDPRPHQAHSDRAHLLVAVPHPGLDVSPPMELEAFLRFSADDLFYSTSDLDRAMDLLAICRRSPAPAVD